MKNLFLFILFILSLKSFAIDQLDCSSKSNQHCVGTQVFTDEGYYAKITAISKNGLVFIKPHEGHTRYELYAISNLGLVKGCTENNFCTGDIVRNKNGNRGIITGAFTSNRIYIRFERTFRIEPLQRTKYFEVVSKNHEFDIHLEY